MDAKARLMPKRVLAKVGDGKTILAHRKNQAVFTQTEIADNVFCTQQGNIKLTVVSKQGKEAVGAFLYPGRFSGKAVEGKPEPIIGNYKSGNAG
jgi:CRP/FNR family cyclic AMP-dependent transcriptional regulator